MCKSQYQEAFDYIATATNGADGIAKQMLVLQELVDKATPKKTERADKQAFLSFYKCPVCHSVVSLTDKHCYNCGQRIDTIIGDEYE